MKQVSLNDIKVIELNKISTNKSGEVMHYIKRSDIGYIDFGEVYFSWINYGMIKAWKKHLKMTLNLVVPYGSVRFVFYLPDEDKFRIEEIGYKNYKRIVVPPGIWFGFKGIENEKNLVSNFSDVQHNPNEVMQVDKNKFIFDW
jgi:dTDP-4-dehydrorhamnose 3,5-epimerase